MGAIKAVVIGMGVLILVGFVVVAVTLVMRTQDMGTPTAAFQGLVTLPPGTRIAETRVGDGRIVLRLDGADGSQSLLILNATDGSEQGRVNLAVTPH
ncbi:MAG: hypothetical protein KDC18_03280 [Alphaproteobacteria bacterium]|nr:hypothetical protein [Alphaproteobacteria bacterium]MCB9931398.1 hypothetical protein [Alphaproteobacteria bacterium]